MLTRREFLPLSWLPEAIQHGAENLSPEARRSLLVDLTIASSLLVACGVTSSDLKPNLIAEPLTTPELAKIGQELDQWKLSTGAKMADLFPDVQKSANLLQGKINLEDLIPLAKPPIRFSTGTRIGEVVIHRENAIDDPKNTEIILTSGKTFNVGWLRKGTPVTIKLSPDVLQSTGRWPIVVKEASQIYDYLTYTETYLNLLRNAGVKINFKNPSSEPIARNEEIFQLGNGVRRFEESQQGYSSFSSFVDMGSALKTAVVFANWYKDQQQTGQSIPNADWIEAGKFYQRYMESKGLIGLRNGIYVWLSDQEPRVDSIEFYRLVAEFVNNNFPERKMVVSV